MRQVCTTILSANADATRTGAAWDTNQMVSASFQFATADLTAAGTVKIQMSNDNPAPSGNSINNQFIPTNWSDIPNATSTIVAGVGPGIVIPNMCFRYVRAVFTRTGGAAANVKVLANGLSI